VIKLKGKRCILLHAAAATMLSAGSASVSAQIAKAPELDVLPVGDTALPEFQATAVLADPADIAGPDDRSVDVFVSQTRTIVFPVDIVRVAVADDHIADFRAISEREIYVLGKAVGRTNLIVWTREGHYRSIVLDVGVALEPLRKSIERVLPEETGIGVENTGASIVLTGEASSTIAARTAATLANAAALQINQQLDASRGLSSQRETESSSVTGATPQVFVVGGTGLPREPDKVVQVIDLLGVSSPQQVMLEVRIAEVSRSLADSLGIGLLASGGSGTLSWGIGSGFFGLGAGGATLGYSSGNTDLSIDLDAEQRNGQLKILAEPNIVALSGSEASFNVGGKLLIPVAQAGNSGTLGAVTLEERNYGVGLAFTPMVLRDGLINLEVSSEVSEVSKEPITFLAGSAIPNFTTSQVSTSVQVPNGQSLIIGGLIKNTSGATIKRFPLLGDLPILGALFRSQAFQSDQTELVIVIRPVLVGTTIDTPALPTDDVSDPSREDMWLDGTIRSRRQ